MPCHVATRRHSRGSYALDNPPACKVGLPPVAARIRPRCPRVTYRAAQDGAQLSRSGLQLRFPGSCDAAGAPRLRGDALVLRPGVTLNEVRLRLHCRHDVLAWLLA